MPDEEERIDIGAELGSAGKLDDQLLRDLKDVAQAEQIRKTVEPKKAARSAAQKKKLNMYAIVGVISAVILLIVAYFVMVKPGSEVVTNKQSGAGPIPQTTIAAPVTNTVPATPTNVPPANAPSAPMGGQDANGYGEAPM